VLGREAPVEVHVERFDIERPRMGLVDLGGKIAVDNRTATIAGQAERDLDTSLICDVELSVDISEPATEARKYEFLEGLGAARLQISGSEGQDAMPSRINTEIDIDRFVIKLEHDRQFDGAIQANASLVS